MAETTQASAQDQNNTTPDQTSNNMDHQQNDTQVDTDEEFPISLNEVDRGSPSTLKVKGEVMKSDYLPFDEGVNSFGEQDQVDKELESPLILAHGGVPMMMDRPSFISTGAHMFVPVGDVQSKGLPSNGVVGNGGLSPPPLQGDELKASLMRQVEYYFSKDNLATDKYLLSQMDGDNFVPVTIVANFNQVKRLTTDLELIVEVVKESPVLQIDEVGEKIRAIPEKRCILILREIPQETPQQDIMDLFSGGKCPNFISCEFAENSCWYVTFESEDDAQKAFAFLREEVRTFLGQPIRARIKATSVQRSSGLPKKPRVNYPMQPMYNGTRMQYFPQQSGLPWSSPPNATTASAPSGTPYYDRSNYYIPSNGYGPPQFGPPNRFQSSYPQQANGGRSALPDGPERGRGPSSGRGARGDRPFSPPLSNGGDSYAERDRGSTDRGNGRSGLRGEHSRGDNYGSSSNGNGPGERSRYPRDDNQRKIPRLNKNRHMGRPPAAGTNGGTVSRENADKDKSTTNQRQARAQQNLDLAPVHFPPLPTTDTGVVSPNAPPTTTPPHIVEGTETKNGSNLADIVKGKRMKEGAPPLSTNSHPPLPSSTNGTSIQLSQATETNANPIGSSPVLPVSQTLENTSTKPNTSTTQTNAQSVHSSSISNHTNPPSIAAVVASNIPPTPSAPAVTRTVSQTPSTTLNNTTTVTTTSSSSTPVTTAASVVASGAQSTVTTAVVGGNSVGQHGPNHNHSGHGRPYQAKGQRSDSKGNYRADRSERGYYSNGAKQGRYNDKDNSQNRQNTSRNSQVSKDGRSAPANKRNRDRDRDRRQGGGSNYRNIPSRPSPKPSKKHQPPQAPPPPPTPTNEDKDTPTATKPDIEKDEIIESNPQNDGKSEKLSYAQMAQRKKAPPSPVPPPPPTPKQEGASENTETTKASSAPTSPHGPKDTKNTKMGQSNSLKPAKSSATNQKSGQNSSRQPIENSGSVLATPPVKSTTLSKSAPTSPCKESTTLSTKSKAD